MPDDYYVSQYSGEEIDALLGSAGAGTVRYDAAQTLTDAQKTQARNNISAMQGIESTDHPGCNYVLNGSTVEWINPPMQLGGMDADGNPINEYRTTERYMGKPVYYQRISYGTTLPASGFTQRVVSTLPIATTNILDIDVTVKNGTTYEVQKLPCISDSGVVLSVANAIQYNNYDNYCIRVRVFSDMSAWSIQKIVVKYTKTTD